MWNDNVWFIPRNLKWIIYFSHSYYCSIFHVGMRYYFSCKNEILNCIIVSISITKNTRIRKIVSHSYDKYNTKITI